MSTGLAFIGPDTPAIPGSLYGEACLAAKANFPILGVLTATFFAFLVGVIFGVLIMLRYPMFSNENDLA
jgi:hypothetical protein